MHEIVDSFQPWKIDIWMDCFDKIVLCNSGRLSLWPEARQECRVEGEWHLPVPQQAVEVFMQSEFIGQICMVRTYSAGVFYGKLVAKDGLEVRLENARRVWYWDGAATLSELAQRGTSKPTNCKFPCTVPQIELSQAIETIPMSDAAIQSLDGVPVWSI